MAFSVEPSSYVESALKKWITPESKQYLYNLIKQLEQQEDFSVDALSNVIKSLRNELSIKLVKLAQPIRIAITGSDESPGIFELLSLLSKEETLACLQAFVDFL